jgi:hypothetical protein
MDMTMMLIIIAIAIVSSGVIIWLVFNDKKIGDHFDRRDRNPNDPL